MLKGCPMEEGGGGGGGGVFNDTKEEPRAPWDVCNVGSERTLGNVMALVLLSVHGHYKWDVSCEKPLYSYICLNKATTFVCTRPQRFI